MGSNCLIYLEIYGCPKILEKLHGTMVLDLIFDEKFFKNTFQINMLAEI